MSPIHEQVQAEMDMPIINGVTAGYKFTEMILSLRLFSSRIQYPLADGDRFPMIKTVVDAIGGVQDNRRRSGFRSDGLASG